MQIIVICGCAKGSQSKDGGDDGNDKFLREHGRSNTWRVDYDIRERVNMRALVL